LDVIGKVPNLELRLGRIVQNGVGSFTEKGTDVLFSADIIYYAAKDLFDTGIVFAEEDDFAYPMVLVKGMGKNIELCHFRDIKAKALLKASDNFISLEKVLDRDAERIFPPEFKNNVVPLKVEKKVEELKAEEPPVKRKRGRPRKNPILDGLKKIIEG
jgi:hypothetical protein